MTRIPFSKLAFKCAPLAITIMAMTTFPTIGKTEQQETVVFLVRHAEKIDAGRDPALSAAGRQRALLLAGMLRDADIGHIYSTDFIRTRATAQPLADLQGLAVKIYDWSRMDELAVALSRPGSRSLVVGHSNTTPELAELLGGEAHGEIDEAGEYDRLYILNVQSPGEADTVLIRYGNSGSQSVAEIHE